MSADDTNHLPVLQEPLSCANCGAVVAGPFCSGCGQRTDTHAHSLGHFLSVATEVLTHADARVWATLWPLLMQPGFLTREYFAGRRARYLQPFRLYIVISVLFFLVSALLNFGSGNSVIEINKSLSQQQCTGVHTDLPGRKWLEPRLAAACEHAVADHGKAFSESMVHNVGRSMFVFLPLLAALMKLLYWRPQRYYLEHLLLMIHNHASVFLWLSIFMLVVHWIGSGGWITALSIGMSLYLVRYLYRSMKIVYSQSRFLTASKFAVLGFAYLVCALFMLVATTFVSAMTL